MALVTQTDVDADIFLSEIFNYTNEKKTSTINAQ